MVFGNKGERHHDATEKISFCLFWKWQVVTQTIDVCVWSPSLLEGNWMWTFTWNNTLLTEVDNRTPTEKSLVMTYVTKPSMNTISLFESNNCPMYQVTHSMDAYAVNKRTSLNVQIRETVFRWDVSLKSPIITKEY